ncbi:MAG: hypothetical protein HYZ83_08455 [Candidatus Omnitrophica bacterium]|nr:hypothetical protein [Candidatus Omnitrophota bacterium]
MMQTVKENEIIFYVGTRKLVAMYGEIRGGEPRIHRHVTRINPDGFKHGFVTCLERASAVLEEMLEALMPSLGSEEVTVFVVLGNRKLKTFKFSSSIYFQGLRRTISSHEIRSVVEQTRSVATLPLSEFVLQSIPESFLINDMPGIHNPLGMDAHRIGVDLSLFTMEFEDFKNINKAFEAAEITVKGYFPKSLLVSEAVLADQEKEEGALVVDMVDDATHLILWKNGKLVNAQAEPLGTNYLDEKMAEIWKIETCDAEKVIEKYATLEKNPQFGEDLIPLVDRNGKSNHQIPRHEFQEKLLAQSRDWMKKILDAAKTFCKNEKVQHPHYIFTGSTTALNGFLEFLQDDFSLDARVGYTKKVEAPNEILIDSSMSAVLGMYRWLSTLERDRQRLFEPKGVVQKTFATARSWFSNYF